MPVIKKAISTKRTCGECSAELTDEEPCEEHPDAAVKKSLIVVRKAEGDEDDDLEAALDEDDENEDDEDEEEEDEETEDEDDEDEDEDDEDEEDEDEDDEDEADLKKSDVSVMAVEALGIATQFAEEIAKVFGTKGSKTAAYEDVMTEFNNVMDAAAERWKTGTTVSKSSKKSRAKQVAIIKNKVLSTFAKAEGKEMPKKPARPKALDDLELPDDVASYIKELEGGDVSKSDSEEIYKGLHPEVAKRLKKADELVEKSEVEHWEEIAKSYKHFPGDKKELAATLRKLHESNPTAFEELKKTLDAAEFNLGQSDVFKSFGSRGGGEPNDEIAKREKEADELVSKGEYPTKEQALVALMNKEGGKHYQPTVSANA